MLSRLSGGSLLLLGAVAIAGMGLIAFASGQSWPSALGGGASSPQQLIGLERPGADIHQAVGASHALQAFGGHRGQAGAAVLAGGPGPGTAGHRGTPSTGGPQTRFGGGTATAPSPPVGHPGSGNPQSGGSSPQQSQAPAPAPPPSGNNGNGNGNGNAFGHSKGGDSQPAPSAPSSNSGSSDSSGNTAPSSPGNGHAYGHSKTPSGHAYGHSSSPPSHSSSPSGHAYGHSDPPGHAYGHEKNGKD